MIHGGNADRNPWVRGADLHLLFLHVDDDVFEQIERHDHITAREVVQHHTAPKPDSKDLPLPEKTEEAAPEDPNVFTDGSVHNPTSLHWQVGGMGIWWPKRKVEDACEA